MDTRKEMGTVHLIIQDVNLQQYPDETYRYKPEKGTEIAIGDLHANALKLIHILIRQNIITLGKESYDGITDIYKKNIDHFSRIDVEIFDAIISKINIINKNAKIILIGDELADRGSNDYFILKIIEKLDNSNVPMDIILSNHGIEFLRYYEANFSSNKFNPLIHPTNSLQNLNQCFNNGIIEKNRVIEIVNKNYLKHLKLLSYTIDKDHDVITLYTHAPNDYFEIEKIVGELNKFCKENNIEHKPIRYNDDKIDDLKNTIDCINTSFHKIISAKSLTSFSGYDPNNIYSQDSSYFFNFIWRRIFDEMNVPSYNVNKFTQQKNGFSIRYCHGHDGGYNPHDILIPENIIVLDNIFGKYSYEPNYKLEQGEQEFSVLISGPGLLELENIKKIKVETKFNQL